MDEQTVENNGWSRSAELENLKQEVEKLKTMMMVVSTSQGVNQNSSSVLTAGSGDDNEEQKQEQMDPERKKQRRTTQFLGDDDCNPVGYVVKNSSAMKEALRNLIVSKEIMMNVHGKDFHNFRLTRQLWNDIASLHVINCHRTVHLQFVYKTSIRGYTRVGKTGFSLSRFNDAFKKSSTFPFNSFCFKCGTLATPDMTEFLTLFGHHIKTLKLIMKPLQDTAGLPDPSVRTFRHLLTRHAPNIERLIFDGFPSSWKDDHNPLFPDPDPDLTSSGQLQKLKTIDFGIQYVIPHILRDILRFATKLEKTSSVYPGELAVLSSTNKLDTVHDFSFTLCPRRLDLESCKIFAASKPKLEHVGFVYEDYFWRASLGRKTELGKCVSEILVSSELTLKKLSLCPIGFLPNITFPKRGLPKVWQLELYDVTSFYSPADQDDHIMFPVPDRNRLSEIFPNVTKIIFNMDVPIGLQDDDNTTGSWQSLFIRQNHDPPLQPLLKVKVLKIVNAHDETAIWMERMAPIFPNVEFLDVSMFAVNNASKVCQAIWSFFTTIKTLRIEIGMTIDGFIFAGNQNINPNSSWCLDSAFTGLSPETCTQLWRNSRNMTVEDVKNLREYPSIVNLTNLVSLNIYFNLKNQLAGVWSANRLPVLSHVTGLYGFRALKQEIGRGFPSINFKSTPPAAVAKTQLLESALESVLDYVDEVQLSIADDES